MTTRLSPEIDFRPVVRKWLCGRPLRQFALEHATWHPDHAVDSPISTEKMIKESGGWSGGCCTIGSR